jgi:hypothetical protein
MRCGPKEHCVGSAAHLQNRVVQVLNHAACKGPGVGSQDARDLIKALMTDPEDTDAMKRASAAMTAPARSQAT